MRQQFREFYFNKDNEDIWEESIIVLDTNVLLNLYRYTKETSDQILSLLQKYEKNLWMPHQVALEYHYNRKSVIVEQSGSYKKVCDTFNEVPDKIRNMLNQDLSNFKKRHKEDVDSFIKIIKDITKEQINKLKDRNDSELDLTKEDTIKNKITDLFLHKVGKPYEESKLKDLENEADARLKNKIPPGYKDYDKKKGNKFHNGVVIQNKYGDLILWKQLLDFAGENEVNIIFLTDEQKEDWWYDINNQIIGPRIELLNEFTHVTNKEFHMFSSIGFVERHSSYFNETAVSEVREVTKEYTNIEKLAFLNNQFADKQSEAMRLKEKGIKMMNLFSDLEHKSLFEARYNVKTNEEIYEIISESLHTKIEKSSFLSFCYWFKDYDFTFDEFEEGYERFYAKVKNEFTMYIADKIMNILYRLNIVETDPANNSCINMNELRNVVYGYLVEYDK
ncbi:PIN-like domain-containing protein [Bacillus sp. NPDC093026]|uniref:PIN-like domain-containing protein n=1 Tax=Bacillus sp. NPDC093026 TaxID=3363948 RepID=UPI0037F2493B